MKEWLVWTVFAGFVSSFVAFFFDWRIALSDIVFFYLFSKAASLFSKEFDEQTVRQLTEKIAGDNYLEVRRKKGTVNNNEVFKTIQDTFSADLGLDKSLLTMGRATRLELAALLPTWALRHPGDRIDMLSSCNSDRAIVFWPCTKKLRPSRAAEHHFRPAQSPTRCAAFYTTSITLILLISIEKKALKKHY